MTPSLAFPLSLIETAATPVQPIGATGVGTLAKW
jgi:hypothetical protein